MKDNRGTKIDVGNIVALIIEVFGHGEAHWSEMTYGIVKAIHARKKRILVTVTNKWNEVKVHERREDEILVLLNAPENE